MADNDKIVIDQINWGTNLPEWATEATQLKIAEKLGAIKKDADKSSKEDTKQTGIFKNCLLYTSPSPRDGLLSRMPSSA